MSYAGRQDRVSLKAQEDLSAMQFMIVELDTSNALGCKCAQSGQGYGVLLNHPKQNEAASVAVDGECRVIAGGSVSVGDWLTSANSGYSIAVHSNAAATNTRILGRAKTSASSGMMFTADIDIYLMTNSGAAGF